MAQMENSEPVVRNLTQGRYAGMKDYSANEEAREKSGGMAVMLMAAVLVMGVAGVLIFGPEKAVNAVIGLVASSKAPQDAPPEPAVTPEPKPAKSTSARRQPAPVVAVARLETPVAVPVPVTPSPPPVRPAHVRLGIGRRELLELFGTPDMKATSIEEGHLVENYSYLGPSRAQQVIVLKDGRVVATDAN